MRTWKFLPFVASFGLVVLLVACRTAHQTETRATNVPAELVQPAYLYEVVRHLYRWYLDEDEVERVVQARHFVFRVRRLEARLDPGDQSLLGEIFLPQFGISAKVKKADYHIEELHTEVKSQTFKITQVTRMKIPAPGNYSVVEVETKEMLDYLFRTRSQRDYPDPALLERMREALRKEFTREGVAFTNASTAEQIVHCAPLSPVANEIWIYWETGRKLLHFASDIDLSNPAVWQHETMMVRFFDLDQQVVLSHEEAPGSNRFLTRHQVGRALFNCVLLGQRVTMPPRPPPGPGADAAAGHSPLRQIHLADSPSPQDPG